MFRTNRKSWFGNWHCFSAFSLNFSWLVFVLDWSRLSLLVLVWTAIGFYSCRLLLFSGPFAVGFLDDCWWRKQVSINLLISVLLWDNLVSAFDPCVFGAGFFVSQVELVRFCLLCWSQVLTFWFVLS